MWSSPPSPFARRLLVGGLVAVACAGHHAGPPSLVPHPGRDAIETRLVLIGDAGNPDPAGEPVLQALSRDLEGLADRAVVVFLGDNVYPDGLPDSASGDRQEGERRLNALVDAVRRSGARGILLPGNHDWERGGDGGWASVRREERYIAERGGGRVRMLPGGGCPGPSVAQAGRRLTVIALDTQWWFHNGDKPRDPTSTCPADTPEELVDSLRAALRRAASRYVVVVAHHPLASNGPHGGYFPLSAHLFPLRQLAPWLWVPLPIIGSVHPIARQLGVSKQDLTSDEYQRMRAALESAMAAAPPLVYAGGHEHALQVLDGPVARYLLVSGSGYFGHVSPVSWRENTRFARAASGFMRLDVLRDGQVRLGVVIVDKDGTGTEAYSQWLE